MFIFLDEDNKYKVALERTNAIVVFINRETKETFTEVENLEDLLECDYLCSKYPEAHDISKAQDIFGGRRWKSLKFYIADKIGMSKEELLEKYAYKR